MAGTALKQMLKFIVRIKRMKPERWVKMCSRGLRGGLKIIKKGIRLGVDERLANLGMDLERNNVK